MLTGAVMRIPLCELVEGFDDIADRPIPYARLPKRVHSAYAGEFSRWSDIAGETAHSLLGRPKAGKATVHALLAAASEAVVDCKPDVSGEGVQGPSAVRRVIDALDERDRVMLDARVWAFRPDTQLEVATRLGVNQAWVQRNQQRALARFLELAADPAYQEAGARAAELSSQIGAFAPRNLVDCALRRVDVEPESQEARALLYLAGPFEQCGDWLENSSRVGRSGAVSAVDAVFGHCAAAPTESLVTALTDVGLVPAAALEFLKCNLSLRRFGEVWVRWSGSVADRAEAVLHAYAAPASPLDLCAAIGGGSTLRSVQDTVYCDRRFARVTRQTWGLRSWELAIYTGIFDEIANRIEAAGGQVSARVLIDDIVSNVPDVAEGSVRTCLNTLAFITENDIVRRRNEADPWPPVGPLRNAPGTFRNGDNEIRLALIATAELMRGSSRPIHPAVAIALGVRPGERRAFTSPHGRVAVTWRLSSTNGPNIGSLRAMAHAAGAAPGDTLVLAFTLDNASLDGARIDPGAAGMHRLQLLLGDRATDAKAALAESLGCRWHEVSMVLRERGDDALADLVDDQRIRHCTTSNS